MPFDFLSPICTKTPRWVPLEKTNHDALGIDGHVVRELKRVREDSLIHRVHVFIVEGRETSLFQARGKKKAISAAKNASLTIIS